MHFHSHNGHGHNHDSHHHHVHSGGHSHSFRKGSNKIFFLGISINILFVIVEAYYGFIANSLALLSDAAHNLGDVAGLALSWVGLLFAMRGPKGQFTYGLQSASILTAIVNSVILLIGVGAILLEAFHRFSEPASINSDLVMIVAGIGILINGGTAFLLFKLGMGELNIRAAFWHMAGDALVSVGVVIAALVVKYTGWQMIDGITSIAIAAVILYASWGLLKDSIVLSLHASPKEIDVAKVKEYLLSQNGVEKILDLHIWAISTTETALSCHLLMPQGARDEFLIELENHLEEEFKIGHSTIQIMKVTYRNKEF
jgi:cobalt-zinc-cadmium efflux system protein